MIKKTMKQLENYQGKILQYQKEEEDILERIRVYHDRDDDVLLIPLDVHMQLLIPNLRRTRELLELLEGLSNEICGKEEHRTAFYGIWVSALDEKTRETVVVVKETSALVRRMVPALSDAEYTSVGELRKWGLDVKVSELTGSLQTLAAALEDLKGLFEGISLGYQGEKKE